MSISAAKHHANDLNAQHSTGPRTAEGKARSSRNAIKHGLFCKDLLLPGEDASAFASMRDGLLRRLNPRDVLETQIVDQYIASAWKLQRLQQAEHEAYLDEIQTMKQELQDRVPDAPTPLPEPDSGLVMWRMMQGGKDATLERLSRHEQRLWNTMQRCLKDLEKLQQQEIDIEASVEDDDVQNEPTDVEEAANSSDEKGLYRSAWEEQRVAAAQAERLTVDQPAADSPPCEKSAA